MKVDNQVGLIKIIIKFIQNHNDLYAIALHLLMERCCMQITDEKGRNTHIPAMMFADSRKNNNNNKLDSFNFMKEKRA